MVRSIPLWLPPCLILPLSWIWYRLYATDYAQGGLWGCEMSWMMPSYIPIKVPDSPVPRYNLYLYRENGWDDGQPSGHPVIFIPGNAGSYQQVRSIASSASRQYHGHPGEQAVGKEGAKQIDLFTLDLNEDFSAFHGQTIRDQAAFLVSSVHRVLSLYNGPRTITLLGHSMGGIVARLAVTMGIGNLIDVVLTMSTPHLLAPVTLDPQVEVIYREIKSSVQPALLSVCGGLSDSQIASDACAIDLNTSDGFAVFTTGMPGVWTGVDHQAMVWCHQVRWRIARVLLEMTKDHSKADRLATAARWLLPGEKITAASDATSQRIYQISGSTMFLTRRRPTSIHICDEGICQPIIDYHLEQIPIPKSGQPFPLSGEGIQAGDTGYVLLLDATGSIRLGIDEQDVIHGSSVASISSSNEWTATHTAAHHELYFPSVRMSSLIAYRVIVEVPSCSAFRPIIKHTSISADHVHEARFFPADATDILLHSHSGSAPFVSSRGSGLSISIYQSPDCGVARLMIRPEIWRSLAKGITRYRMAAIAWALGWWAASAAGRFGRPESNSTESVPLSGITMRQILLVYWCLLLLSVLQSVMPAVLARQLLLGVTDTDLETLLLCASLATWTLLFSLTVYFAFAFVATLCFKSNNRKERGEQSAVLFTAKCLLASVAVMLIPQEIIMCLIFAYQTYVFCMTGSPQAGAVLLLMFHLLPFSLAPIAAWARGTMTDWRHAPTMGHNPLAVIPSLGLTMLSGNSVRHERRFPWLPVVCLRMASALCFVIGPRHTYLLPYAFNLVMLVLWVALWPESVGKTRQ